jgi:putative membrane protein
LTESRKDSSYNLSRRYRHLFRLPSSIRGVLFASIPTILLALLVQSTFHVALAKLVVFALATELTLLATIEIDQQLLKRRSGVATYRRLAAIAIISNTLWLVPGLLGLLDLFLTHIEGRFLALIILGMFFAISFRAFVFGSVFYRNTIHGLPLAFLQPALLAIAMTFPWAKIFTAGFQLIAAGLAGLVLVIAIEVYLRSINSAPLGDLKPLQLLQAFLSAWTLEERATIEDILEKVSRSTQVKTSMMKIDGKSSEENALLVVPGIHPGPFYPIGSSNLPDDIYSKLRTAETIPLTVHSISDHELNLPSKLEVENYVTSLKHAERIDQGRSMTLPCVKKQGKATVTGITFGSTCVIALTQAPYGMEDFPTEVRKEIEERAVRLGFKLTLVIDTHNSEGAKPNDAECQDAIGAASAVIEELSRSKQQSFRIGFAHTSEIKTSAHEDIGPAGMGLLYFDLGADSSFCLVIVDANNCKLGFREKVFQEFERTTGNRILELCTSDTHVTAAKTPTAKGYLALGDLISTNDFVAILNVLLEKARNRVAEGSFSASSVLSHVRTIGSEILEEFSGLTDSTLSTAKRGAKLLTVLVMALVIIVAIA